MTLIITSICPVDDAEPTSRNPLPRLLSEGRCHHGFPTALLEDALQDLDCRYCSPSLCFRLLGGALDFDRVVLVRVTQCANCGRKWDAP
eukprot:scaffold157558_cov35-Tisochrysis_lutea.AAC.7